MSLDHHFKFLILLALEADNSGKMEARKKYFGMCWNGEVALCRGTPVRARYIPLFIREFELKILKTLFDCETSEQVAKGRYEDFLEILTREIDKVMTGELSRQEVMVERALGRNLNEFKIIFPHVGAALQLATKGRILSKGDSVQFVFKDSSHANILNRTQLYEMID